MCYFGVIFIMHITQFHHLRFCYQKNHFIHIHRLTGITYIPPISLLCVSDLCSTTSHYFNLKLRHMFRHYTNNPFYIYYTFISVIVIIIVSNNRNRQNSNKRHFITLRERLIALKEKLKKERFADLVSKCIHYYFLFQC
jgi:hypothetical protein